MKIVLVLAAMFSFASLSHAKSPAIYKNVGCLNVDMKMKQVASQFHEWQRNRGPAGSAEEVDYNLQILRSFANKYETLWNYELTCRCAFKDFWSQPPAKIAKTIKATIPKYCRP